MKIVKILVVLISLASMCAARYKDIDYDDLSTACIAAINPTPFIKIGDGYYVVNNEQKLNWFGAANFCRRLGADLVSFEKVEELDALSAYINTLGTTSSNAFWLSGNHLENAGVFYWLGTGQPMEVTRWAPGQPDNVNNFQHCVLLYKAGTDFAMYDTECYQKANFICEANDLSLDSVIIW